MTDHARESAYERWQQVGHTEGTLSVPDVARRVAEESGVLAPLVRALCVEDVYLQVRDGDLVSTSTSDADRFVHVWSSPARAMTELTLEDDRFDVRAVRLAPWLRTLPDGTGVRLDPGTAGEVVLDPARLRLLAATAAGVPTPAALTPALEERLLPQRGPAGTTELDRLVRDAVGGRVRRCVVRLDGVGGRDWPTYLVDGDGRDPLAVAAAVEEVARRPVALLVDGAPAWLAELLEPAQSVAVDLDDLGDPEEPVGA